MDDYLTRYRMAMIEDFQSSLKELRVRMEYGVSRLAGSVGVTRQTINNLESGRTKMSVSQFLSLAAVVENYISTRGRNAFWVEETVNGGYYSELEHYSILRRWFSCFEDSREILLENSLCRARGEYITAMRQLAGGRYTILLDHGVFFNRKADEFLSPLADLLSEEGRKAVVSSEACYVLGHLCQDEAYQAKAHEALELVDHYYREGVLDVREDVKRDGSSAETTPSASRGAEKNGGLCLITQDDRLRRQVLAVDPPDRNKSLDLLVGFVNGLGRARVQRWRPPASNVLVTPGDLPEKAFDALPPQEYIPRPGEQKFEV